MTCDGAIQRCESMPPHLCMEELDGESKAEGCEAPKEAADGCSDEGAYITSIRAQCESESSLPKALQSSAYNPPSSKIKFPACRGSP
jgi:hypothetical protein